MWAFIAFLPLIIWAGFRGDVGDTWAYELMYSEIPETISQLAKYLLTITKDRGFTVLSGIIKIIVGNNTKLYFLVLAGIQGIILALIYRKYSISYLLSFFLFIASTDYLSWMFNGIRQFTAVTIVFAATGLMLKKKYVPLIAVILAASTVHGTALLMIPIVLIAQGKAWNKRTVIFVLLTVVAVAYVDQFTDILDFMLTDTQYTNVVSDWKSSNDDGTNALRVLVYSVPAILSYVGRRWIAEENDPMINLCTNMSIVSAGLYLISMFTSGIFIGRLPIYASLYSYILLPWEIDHVFTRRSSKIILMMLIALYLVFYYYQTAVAWG